MSSRATIAREIFEEIRDRPFRVALSANEPADNCYFKCMELAKTLVIFGYNVRGRLGEIDWRDTPLPQEILDLYPNGTIDTHFYLEVFAEGEWRVLDPTWNKSFAVKYRLPYSEFGAENEPCFRITKLYDVDAQTTYAWSWLNHPETIEEYMRKTNVFFTAVNQWLEENNK